MKYRVGQGYDVHPWAEGRPLVLGGVEIPHDHGLKGHSDADVLLHAVCDALLGAMAMGDIGTHFPDKDPAYKGISSLLLLEKVARMLKDAGWRVSNLDATVVAERPRLAPYIPLMRERIAEVLGIEVDRVSVKATTSERLGFVGRQEGAASQAVVLLEQDGEI
ncbi:MAG: 2-C-methyl-D-erythritol 2,4-cyclodiphosphate synthase [bacterium]